MAVASLHCSFPRRLSSSPLRSCNVYAPLFQLLNINHVPHQLYIWRRWRHRDGRTQGTYNQCTKVLRRCRFLDSINYPKSSHGTRHLPFLFPWGLLSPVSSHRNPQCHNLQDWLSSAALYKLSTVTPNNEKQSLHSYRVLLVRTLAISPETGINRKRKRKLLHNLYLRLRFSFSSFASVPVCNGRWSLLSLYTTSYIYWNMHIKASGTSDGNSEKHLNYSVVSVIWWKILY